MALLPLESISEAAGQALLDLARQVILSAVEQRPSPSAEPIRKRFPYLSEAGASFVTLTLSGQLRGCIGTLQARRALIEDVAENAYAAAFRDPRFDEVGADEVHALEIEISVLGIPKTLAVSTEQQLIENLLPGVHGLILEFEWHKATFLPTVWRQLKDPATFVAALKRKAGLPEDFWSPAVRCSTYETITFSEKR